MKTSKQLTFRLKRRYYNILTAILPAFWDPDLDDPYRGAKTRALEHVLQYYSESEDFLRKARIPKKRAKYLVEKDREYVESFVDA